MEKDPRNSATAQSPNTLRFHLFLCSSTVHRFLFFAAFTLLPHVGCTACEALEVESGRPPKRLGSGRVLGKSSVYSPKRTSSFGAEITGEASRWVQVQVGRFK